MQNLSFLSNELKFYSILEEKVSSCNASVKSKKTNYVLDLDPEFQLTLTDTTIIKRCIKRKIYTTSFTGVD